MSVPLRPDLSPPIPLFCTKLLHYYFTKNPFFTGILQTSRPLSTSKAVFADDSALSCVGGHGIKGLPSLSLERMEAFHIRPRFEAASSDAALGAGKEAECRYIDLVRKRSYFDISAISVDTHSHLFSMRVQDFAPDRSVSPAGRDHPAPWSPRKRFRGRGCEQGAVSRPERSGGRVTATQRQRGSPSGADGRGC